MKLTGRRRYRLGWFGRLILQVELEGWAMWPYGRTVTLGRFWRDATVLDLQPLGEAAA